MVTEQPFTQKTHIKPIAYLCMVQKKANLWGDKLCQKVTPIISFKLYVKNYDYLVSLLILARYDPFFIHYACVSRNETHTICSLL